MFIKRIYLQNYKCFGEPAEVIDFKVPDGKTIGSGLNILVGENNSGKSTVFEAIDFVRNGVPRGKSEKELKNKKSEKGSIISVDIQFSGKVNKIVSEFAQANKKDVIEKYLFNENGETCFRICRNSEKFQSLALWNNEKQSYKNETGIDAPLKKLFELDFIWADTNPSSESKFGSTTICGRLLKEIASTFEETKEFRTFQEEYDKVFNSESSALRSGLLQIEKRTQEIFASQFGNAKLTFRFDEVSIESVFKNVRILVDDGVPVYLEDKGSGMQRSVALALLQVYAENLVRNTTGGPDKPFFLFIDEPEACLHPQAQIKLLNAVIAISKDQQVFIATHSPYFVSPQLIENIIRFSINKDGSIRLDPKKNKNLIKQVQTGENRTFLLRHRNLLFSDCALFLEGVSDYERYAGYCGNNGFKTLPQYFMMMNGCDQTFFFYELCEAFGIKPVAIVDKDFSFNRPFWKNPDRIKIMEKIKAKCDENSIAFDFDKFTKEVIEKEKETAKLGEHEIQEVDIKGVKVNKVKQKDIFVLRLGEVEDYLDSLGRLRDDAKSEKEKELKAIFEETSKVIDGVKNREI